MRKPFFLLSIVTLLLLRSPLLAETLDGRIFLGPGLGLFLEKDEGLFRSMLRAMALVGGEVPILDLTALEISRTHLFLAEDGKLYVRDQEDSTVHPVGTWSTPDQVTLDPGIVLEVARTNSEIFEGEDQRGLLVRLNRAGGIDAAEVAPTSFSFWMDQLGEVFLPGAMTNREEEISSLLIRALIGALPSGPSPTAEQAENLKALKNWVETNRFGNLEAVEPVLSGVLARVRGDGVTQYEQLTRYELSSLKSLESFYLDIQQAVGNP